LLEPEGGGQSGQPGADHRNASSGFARHAASFPCLSPDTL
jgi:hypothetical protein